MAFFRYLSESLKFTKAKQVIVLDRCLAINDWPMFFVICSKPASSSGMGSLTIKLIKDAL